MNYCIFYCLKIFRAINSLHDCLLLQSDINSVSDWGAPNSMELNITNTHVISYSRKTNILITSISFAMLPV
jgi:hypothetical protein